MVQPIFDAGMWLGMMAIGFLCLILYRKIGALLLIISVLAFLICGLVILIGDDVAFFSTKYQGTITSVAKNDTTSRTITTTTTVITPQNQTNYLIGNGQFPITGTGQIWVGYSLIILTFLMTALFIDRISQDIRYLIRGD